MSGFTLFKRGQCPICSGAAKGCRESKLTSLIFCRDNSANATGYIYRGEDSWGFSLWQPSSDAEAFNQQAGEERQRRRQEFLAAEQRRRQEQIARQLSAVERHKWYTKLLDQLSLKEDDKQSLLSRGFTEKQIINDGYRSIAPWQKLVKGQFPPNLPGLLSNGAINAPGDGILCPIRTQKGLIVGCQIRLHDSKDGRYRWLTSATKKNPDGATPHLDGELPLGLFEPEQFNGDSIWLTEGTAIKPSLTRYRLGVPVLGAASGRFNGSPDAALTAVRYLSAKYTTNVLTFAVDAGDVVNFSGVPERWKQQFEFFSTHGYECRIGWWGQIQKSDDDIDELADTSKIQYITPNEFWAIVEEYRNISPQEKKTKEDFNWAWENWLKSRRFSPDVTLNQNEFGYGKIPDSNVIVAIRSGLGTGKTQFLINMIKQSGRGAILLGYRNNLLIQTSTRAAQLGLSLYHLRQDDGAALIADESTHQVLCLDSIHHIDGYFKGRDIYLDETCSVLLHAINGGTLGDMQAKALRIFTKALEDCNRIFLLDGNLADIYVNFIAKIAKNKKVLKIENQRKIPSHTIKVVEGIDEEGEIRKRDRSPLIQFLMQPDVIPWIFCDSRERANILYKILTNLGRTGFILSSETAGEPWAKELLSDPDQYILNTKPQFALVTPTAESGVSVALNGYFTHKLSFFVGVQGTNSQHQSMFRLRDDTVEHYVFCPEHSNVRDRANPNTYSAKKFKEILDERIVQSAVLAGHSAANSERVLEVIGSAIARQNDDWWEFSARLGVVDNFEMDNLRKCLVHALEEAGHDIEIFQWDTNQGIKNLEKKARESVRREYAQEVYAAIEFNSIEEAKQKAKSNPRKETQRRIEKTFLLDRLPGIKDSELWNDEFIYECYVSRRDFINQQQRFYLVNNFEISQKRHEVNWFYQATGEDFFSARVKRMSHDVIWALRELNILQFIDKEYHKNSLEVIDFIKVLRERGDIQIALRIHLKPETSDGKERLEILGNLLNLIGYKNASTGQKFVGDVRLRHYQAKPTTYNPDRTEDEFNLEAARLEILKAIEYKLITWMQSEKSQIDWEPETQTEETEVLEPAMDSPAAVSAAILTAATTWEDVTLSQQELNLGWQLLTLQEQKRLEQMYQAWQAKVEMRSIASEAEPLQTSDVDSIVKNSAIAEQIQKVDTEIRRITPLCNLEELSQTDLWVRRLNRAVQMGSSVAESVYRLLPPEILDSVWSLLNLGVQDIYCGIFATG